MNPSQIEKQISVIAAKVSMNENLFSKPIIELVDLMVQALKHPTIKYPQIIKEKDYLWALSSGKEYEIDEETVIFGKIIKTSPEIIHEWDFDSETEIENLAPNFLSGLCHYVFNPRTEIIVFHCNPKVPVKQMTEAFSKLCEINGDGLGEIQVIPFPRDKDLTKAINDMAIITRVKFNLIPSNPEITPEFEALERALGGTGSVNTTLDMKGPELKYDGTIIEQGTRKIIAGQGHGTYFGKDQNNNDKVISSRNYSEKLKPRVVYSEKGIFTGLISVLSVKTKVRN